MTRTTYLEIGCAVEHQGRTHVACGAMVSPDRLVAYVGANVDDRLNVRHPLTTWRGERIGDITFTSSWRIRSAMGSRMFQARATVDGVTYVGRTLGAGMAFSGRRAAA